MPTIQQLIRHRRKKQYSKKKNRALDGRPQARGVVESITVIKPKKPNSSNKFVAKVLLQRIQRRVTVYEPGEGHGLQQHSIVLVEGGPIQDLVGCRYRICRGAKGYDSKPPFEVNATPGAVRQQARSKYGQNKSEAHAKNGMDPGQEARSARRTSQAEAPKRKKK